MVVRRLRSRCLQSRYLFADEAIDALVAKAVTEWPDVSNRKDSLKTTHASIVTCQQRVSICYSHSIVEGGLELMS